MSRSNKKIFATLFFSIFSAATGVGIVVPLLPVYAHDLGASGFYISMIFGAFSLSRTFLLPYFGKLSDKKGRKPLIVIGLLGYTLVSLAFVFVENIDALIAIRIIQGAASAMIMPVTQAYIGDITPEGKEGFFMGLFNLSMFLSLSIGPVIGGSVNEHFSLQAAFASMGVLSLLSFLAGLFLLPPVKNERIVANHSNPMSWGLLAKDPLIAGLFTIRLVYITCVGVIWCFLPVLADMEFGLSSSKIGILVMLPVFTSGLLQIPMGALADKVNKKRMIILGCLITVIALFLLNWCRGFWDLFFSNILFGIGGGIAMPPLMALAVIKGNRTQSMGTVMGLLTTGHSLGMLLGAVLAGLTMDFLNLRMAFPFGAVIMITGICLFTLLMRMVKPSH